MPKILIVGGGYAGFYTAWKLEKLLRRGEAEVTLVDPLSYMTYQPFLPEVAAGSIEANHAVVAFRRHLKKTRIVAARVTEIDPEAKIATFAPADGDSWTEEYDILVVTAGSVTRTFPIPGIFDTAFGMKNIEEAVGVRDRLMGNFNRAANLKESSPLKKRLLSVVVVGGGFAGVETVAELRSLSSYLVRKYPTIAWEETSFHLIEAMGRIMPEVSASSAEWVVGDLRKRGVDVHLDTQLLSAENGVIELSTGETFETDLLIWTAGVMAHPSAKGFGLPMDDRGRVTTRPDLRVHNDGEIVPDVWSAGDVSAVPDLSGGGVGGFCVPNAQHAVRQAKRLAKNIVAVLRGEEPIDYFHKNQGAVAGLGLYNGVFQKGNLAIKGFPAWVAHRGYHGLAMPTWERKLRVFGGWVGNFFLRREIASLALGRPRAVFQEYALRPKARVRAEEPTEVVVVAESQPVVEPVLVAAVEVPVEAAPKAPRAKKKAPAAKAE